MTRGEAQARKHGLVRLFPCLLAAALGGCGGGHPVPRGFDSREVLPLRDATLNLWMFSEKSGAPIVLYSTVPAGTTDLDYWSLDVATGEVENLGSEQPASITAATGPYSCYLETSATDGSQVLDIYDVRTGVSATVDRVLSYATCPRSDGVLTVFRADPTTGSPVLWQGPFAQLQAVALSMDVEAVGQWLFDARGIPTGVLVAAATADQPEAFGLYTLDLGTTSFAEEVPATPASTASAAGAAPAGSLQSTSLATGGAQSIRAIGDHFLYTRTMSDGGTTMFAGPFGTGPASELALFQADPKAVSGSGVPLYQTSIYTFAAGGSDPPPLAAWAPAAAQNGALMIWDEAAHVVAGCPSSLGASPSAVLSPDGARVLFAEFSSSGASAGSVTLLSLAAAAGGSDDCRTLATAAGTGAGFSTDGQSLYWTIASGPVNSELWAAAGDGSSPRMIGSGTLSFVHFLPTAGSQRLEFYLDNDFVWVDLQDDPVALHDVVQQVFEGYYDLGNSWLLIGYQFSTQDGTGTLGLVDRDTGAARPISPSVTSFRAAVAAAPADGGASSGAAAADPGSAILYDVVYVVRGRNPSAQDGIWLARVSAADLQ